MSGGERLRITIGREAAAIVVTLVGDLDVFAAADARAHFDEAINRAVSHSMQEVVVNAAGLEFCDSTGLSMFLRAHEDAEQRGVRFRLQNLSRPLRDLLGITGLGVLHSDG